MSRLIIAIIFLAAFHSSLYGQQDNPATTPNAAPAAQPQTHRPPPLSVIIQDPIRIERETPPDLDWSKAECISPKSHDEADLCEQRRMAHSTEQSVFWTKVQASVAIVGTLFLIWNLYYARKATEAAVTSANTAREMYVADHRAWIKASLHLKNGLGVSQTGVDVEVAALIENIGKSPALHVHTMIDVAYGFDNIPEQIKTLAKQQRHLELENSRLLLAGDRYERPWGVDFIREKISNGTNNLPPVIIGCVTYVIAPDKTLHQTAFAYALLRFKKGKFDGFIDPEEGDLDKCEIGLEVHTGGFAD